MDHVADTLVALGGAFLVCGLIARAGVPIGLPTIPLFVLARVIFGPPESSWSTIPLTYSSSPSSAWYSCFFYLGLEFSLDEHRGA